MTQIQQDFEKLLRAFYAHADALRPFLDFINDLKKTDDLLSCISIYFQLARDYKPSDAPPLTAFYELVNTTLAKGDSYVALHVESLMLKSDTPWKERYLLLSSERKNRLLGQIKQKKAALSPTQKRFLEKFDAFMISQDQKDKVLTPFIQSVNLKFPQLKECLLAYIEVSQRFADDNAKSLVVFYALSFRTLGLGDSYFAAQYEAHVKSEGSVWKIRYDALQPWQRDDYLAPAIRNGKQIATTTRYEKKDAAGNKVPVDVVTKRPIQVDIPADPAQPADQQRRPTQTPLQSKFQKGFDEYMSRSGNSKEDNEFTNFLYARDFGDLRQLVHQYLQASTRYADDDPRSLGIFMLLAATAIAKGDAYYAFKFKFSIEQTGSLWEKRFKALDNFLGHGSWAQDQIKDQITIKEKLARILDNLKFAFFLKNQRDPETAELRKMDLPVSEELQMMLSKAIESCGFAYDSHTQDDFTGAFDKIAEIMKAQKDPLITYALVQQCTRMSDIARNLRLQLTWYLIGAMYTQALHDRPEVYKRGFQAEETEFLFSDADRNNAYFNDFITRLDYLWFKNQSLDEFSKLSKSSALLHFFANSFDMHLVPLEEAAAVDGLVELIRKNRPDFLDKIDIPINSKYGPAKISDTRGEVFVVWWEPNGSGDVYVQIQGFAGLLFGASTWRLGKVYDNDATYGEIYRSTKHLLTILPVFWEFLGYLPDLMTGGLSAVAKSYLFNLALEKTAKALGIDSTAGQLALLGVAMLAHHAVSSGKPSSVTGLEADATSLENRGLGTAYKDPATTNGLLADSTSESRALTEGLESGSSRNGIDMRGIEDNEGHIIRGADEVDNGISKSAAESGEVQGTADAGIANNGKALNKSEISAVDPALTSQDVNHLRDTEKELTAQRADLQRKWQQEDSLARSKGNAIDRLDTSSMDPKEVENLEQGFDKQQAKADKLQTQVGELDNQLKELRTRIAAAKVPQPAHLAQGVQMEAEVAEAFNLGPKNNHVFKNPNEGGANFIPDRIRGNPDRIKWGEKYDLIEIKDWEKMSDTGNVSAMLDYVEYVNKDSTLTIYYKSNTKMYSPLTDRIEGLMKTGKVRIIPFVSR